MGVPIEIRQVKRPVNTIVQDTGKEGHGRQTTYLPAQVLLHL